MSRALRNSKTRVSNRHVRYNAFFKASDDGDIKFHGYKHFPGDHNNTAMHDWMLNRGFRVCTSLIPNAGKGLFYQGKDDLLPGMFVGWYTGRRINAQEARISNSRYMLSSSDGLIHIDAAPYGDDNPCMVARANDNLLLSCDDSHLSIRKVGHKLGVFIRRFVEAKSGEPQELYLHYGVEYWYPCKILDVDWKTRLEWWRREKHLLYKVSATPEQLDLFNQQLEKDFKRDEEMRKQAEVQARHEALIARREEALAASALSRMCEVKREVGALGHESIKRIRFDSAETARKKKRALPYWTK